MQQIHSGVLLNELKLTEKNIIICLVTLNSGGVNIVFLFIGKDMMIADRSILGTMSIISIMI